MKIDKINILYSSEDEGYIATCKDYPGLSSFGETEEDAKEELNMLILDVDDEVNRKFFKQFER